MKKIMLVSLLFLASTPALATSGNDLLDTYQAMNRVIQQTDNDGDQSAAGFYQGYVEATTEMLQMTNHICVPKTVQFRQIFDIVGKFLIDFPEVRDVDGVTLIDLSLSRVYPCKSSKQEEKSNKDLRG